MVKLFGVEIDTSKMTVEETEEIRNEIQEALSTINHELLMKKTFKHKHASS